jgi:hypothetical protein
MINERRLSLKDKSRMLYKAVVIILPLILFIVFLTQNLLFTLAAKLPPCPVYAHFHLYCPACGDTRCVKALMQGDLIAAIRYNICPIVFGIFILLAYLELATFSFGRHIKLLPRKLNYYLIVIAILIVYVGVRNFIPGMTP